MTRPSTDPTGIPNAYCPYYCEENIWHLCANPILGEGLRFVLLVSNPGRQVAVWGQRSAADPAVPVLWDYHAIATTQVADTWRIWDLDTRLGLPLPATAYLQQSFLPVPPRFAPRFRLLSCTDYRRLLASDRRHMRATDGHWLQPPPRWRPIGQGHNLERCIDMDDDFSGELLDLDGLSVYFSSSPNKRSK
jgi:hypothetical protein